ncbi:hypothetical protein, partial [Legionella fairfieldensis]|uniref:hypothetical protein n=1 Tax=Legionella fairfieldensis TaxID=45064 RepID=UPI001A9432D8
LKILKFLSVRFRTIGLQTPCIKCSWPLFIYSKTGFGRKIWNDICNFIKTKKWSQFEFISNPFAVPFYCHMSAEIIANYEEAENESKIMQYKLL